MRELKSTMRYAICGCILACCSCLVDTSLQTDSIKMQRIDGLGDTVSVFPRLIIGFTIPLKETPPPFEILPSADGEYAPIMGRHLDTLIIDVVGMLSGSTRYVIRPGAVLTSTNGTSLGPAADSLVFYTWPLESSQNTTAATADSFSRHMCGQLDFPADTDFYAVADASARGFELASVNQVCALAIRDSAGRSAYHAETQARNIRATAPDSFAAPLMVLVYSALFTGHARYVLHAN